MSASRFEPDAALAVAYLRENFLAEDRLAVVVLNRRTQGVTQRLGSVERIADDNFQAWLCEENARRRCEIYVSMNALRPEARGRTKQDVAAIRHIYLDFDDDGTAALEALLQRPDVPQPNYVINSSPDKWQVAWKVEGFGKDQAETLQKGLAREMGADPAATDCARVLRLPGFLNQKYARPFLVQAQRMAQATYRPEHFPLVAAEDRSARSWNDSPARHAAPSSTPRPISQSERDWAFAKRALTRGESPELIVATIASYRRFDKANPRYYAELTVRKAAAALRLETRGPERR